MALIVDAGPLYSHADADDPRHDRVVSILRSERESLVTSAFAVAEADYLILDRLGIAAELAFLADLAEGNFVVECLTLGELGVARQVAEQYRALEIGIADASLVVLARRFGTRRILTFDERAFRTVAPLQGGTFALLPVDA